MVNWKYVLSLQTMVSYMESHFREKIGLAEIARSAGYSAPRCDVLFRTYLGQSPFDRLRSIRMAAAKDDLKRTRSVEETSRGLAFTSRAAFSRAFRKTYGITPSEYLKGGKLKEQYAEVYEYRRKNRPWYSGKNPAPDGLWEYDYYDPATGEYGLMEWNPRLHHFRAPYTVPNKSDPAWYCRVRQNGLGMHAGAKIHAVKTFLCPRDGVLEGFYSVGRIHVFRSEGRECYCQLYHNGIPITERAYMKNFPSPDFLEFTRAVKKGDRISLHLAVTRDIDRTGVMLYWQKMAYLNDPDCTD